MKSNSSRILGQLNLVLNNPGEYPILKELREPAVLIDSVTEQHNSYLRDKVRFIFRVLYYWHRHHCLVCYTDQTIISYSVDFCIIGQTRLYVNNTDVMQGRIENQSFCICDIQLRQCSSQSYFCWTFVRFCFRAFSQIFGVRLFYPLHNGKLSMSDKHLHLSLG